MRNQKVGWSDELAFTNSPIYLSEILSNLWVHFIICFKQSIIYRQIALLVKVIKNYELIY